MTFDLCLETGKEHMGREVSLVFFVCLQKLANKHSLKLETAGLALSCLSLTSSVIASLGLSIENSPTPTTIENAPSPTPIENHFARIENAPSTTPIENHFARIPTRIQKSCTSRLNLEPKTGGCNLSSSAVQFLLFCTV